MQTIYIAERDIERFVHNYLNSVIQNVFSCIFYYLNKTCNMTTLSQIVWTGDWVPKGPSLQASSPTIYTIPQNPTRQLHEHFYQAI